MYGLPNDFDGAEFVGCELRHVCFSSNTIYIAFEGGHVDGVQLEGPYAYRLGVEEWRHEEVPPEATSLMRLAGKTVRLVEANADGTLILLFDDGAILTCLDWPHYESYSIHFSNPTPETRWTGSRWAGQVLVV